MSTPLDKKSQNRLAIAATLFLASIAASFFIAYISNQGTSYWITRNPIASGVEIKATDVELTRVTLSRGTRGYISKTLNPIGLITERSINAGELLNQNYLTDSSAQLRSESISLSLRTADVPATITAGALITLYQLHDAKNGEAAQEPRLVLTSLYLASLDRKGSNFGGEISLTVSLDRDDVPTLLAATTSGRLVVVASGS